MKRTNTVRGFFVCLVSIGFYSDPASAAPGLLPSRIEQVSVDSRMQPNPSGQARVVFSEVIRIPDAPWVRAIFKEVRLDGDSYVRVVSRLDGEIQILDRRRLEEWQNTTAFFNGSTITIELIAGKETIGNYLSVEYVLVGDPSGAVNDPDAAEGGVARVCELIDTRAISIDARTARLLQVALPNRNDPSSYPAGDAAGFIPFCTGFIIDEAPPDDPNDRCMLSAGHCFIAGVKPHNVSNVAQFEPIPFSQANCNIRHPPVAKQFAINPASVRAANNGPGDDWAVFRCFKNALTGKTVFQEQGAAFALAAAHPVAGTAVRKFGYGANGNPQAGDNLPLDRHCVCHPGDVLAAFNATQQTSSGMITARVGSLVRHNVHDCGGDSGEPLVRTNDDKVVAIGTHGNCANDAMGNPIPANSGTSIRNGNLQTAIAISCRGAIPTVSTWGWITMMLVLLTGAKVCFGRNPRKVAA